MCNVQCGSGRRRRRRREASHEQHTHLRELTVHSPSPQCRSHFSFFGDVGCVVVFSLRGVWEQEHRHKSSAE